MAGTHDDAMLIVELSKWGAMMGLPDASRMIFSEGFDPDTAEMTDLGVQVVLAFNETVATLVKNDLLDRDLVYDWIWVAGTWSRVCGAAERARERTGASNLFENYEQLALASP